jgi:hypothetical protein
VLLVVLNVGEGDIMPGDIGGIIMGDPGINRGSIIMKGCGMNLGSIIGIIIGIILH